MSTKNVNLPAPPSLGLYEQGNLPEFIDGQLHEAPEMVALVGKVKESREVVEALSRTIKERGVRRKRLNQERVSAIASMKVDGALEEETAARRSEIDAEISKIDENVSELEDRLEVEKAVLVKYEEEIEQITPQLQRSIVAGIQAELRPMYLKAFEAAGAFIKSAEEFIAFAVRLGDETIRFDPHVVHDRAGSNALTAHRRLRDCGREMRDVLAAMYSDVEEILPEREERLISEDIHRRSERLISDAKALEESAKLYDGKSERAAAAKNTPDAEQDRDVADGSGRRVVPAEQFYAIQAARKREEAAAKRTEAEGILTGLPGEE